MLLVVVDDMNMVASNSILCDGYLAHCVVIKYVPAVGDSKRVMDEDAGGLSSPTVYFWVVFSCKPTSERQRHQRQLCSIYNNSLNFCVLGFSLSTGPQLQIFSLDLLFW